MSEPKWTRGPWRRCTHPAGLAACWIEGADGKHVTPQHEPDGHMLAAAPEMYEALDQLKAALPTFVATCDRLVSLTADLSLPEAQERIADASAKVAGVLSSLDELLAKARGES